MSRPMNRTIGMVRADALDSLMQAIRAQGRAVLGPTVRDQAIVYEEITSAQELPIGRGDEQEAGKYRLTQRDDEAYFGFVVGPDSWKRFLFPPEEQLFQVRIDGADLAASSGQTPGSPRALFGVRPCELAAIAVQDRVFMGGAHVDVRYASRRANDLIVAVNCSVAAATCFCTSMGTGPRAPGGFDLAITELIEEDGRHELAVEVGSELGAELLRSVPHRPADEDDERAVDEVLDRTAVSMKRSIDTPDLEGLLSRSHESPRWEKLAERCLSCANCTLVCPTCFCSTVEDRTDLRGTEAQRHRIWDSCFTMDHSYIAGGSVRPSTRARYRQWMMHKLGTWQAQFGCSGCVGCGRCITWCPVGIDITEEVAAIRAADTAGGPHSVAARREEDRHDRT